MQTLIAILNSDRIHKARKAIVTGISVAAGILIKQATAGTVSGSDVAYAVGAGVTAALLVYLVPNRS